MKETHDYKGDIATIRSAMERSVKFLSLSGLSGVLAGIYALAGATLVYYLLYYPNSPFGHRFYYVNENVIVLKLIAIAAIVLLLSLVTALVMSQRKAKRMGTGIWNKTSKDLLLQLSVPLVTGGLLILIGVAQGHFGIVVPACLIFYGLALVNASSLTVAEIRYLGFCEIILGLVAALLPGYGLLFWAFGFGVLHIVYGSLMHYRYDS
ncbi:hypothetical protein QQ054_03245 [Oscillatoria amoena NRMC-F 0135]|nr:hypothetical protein [Oscillatoria amoena NRMC-F 0135]